jgi:hypothetical protein
VKLSRAKVVGAVLAVSLLTPALFFLSPSSFANLFRFLPMLAAIVGGGLGVVLLGRELGFIVQKAWRIKESSDVGAGPFRATVVEATATQVPMRVWLAGLVNGAAGLVLGLFGGLSGGLGLARLPFTAASELGVSFEAFPRWLALSDALAWLVAIGMWLAGWALLVRWRKQRSLAALSVAVVTLFCAGHTWVTMRAWQDTGAALLPAWLASVWLLYEAIRMARLAPPASSA